MTPIICPLKHALVHQYHEQKLQWCYCIG